MDSLAVASRLSIPIRDQTDVPCIIRQTLNHWTTREVPQMSHVMNQLESASLSFFWWSRAVDFWHNVFCLILALLTLDMYKWTSLVAQTVKRLSTMWETRVQSLGWEDPLEKEMAVHSRTIAWKIPWTEEPGRLQSMGSQIVGHDWTTSLHFTSSKY